MSQSATILFPHQLFRENPLLERAEWVILVEEYLLFRQYAFHKQKLIFHRASMKAFEDHLKTRMKDTCRISYIEAMDPRSDIRELLPSLKKKGISAIFYMDPSDDWLSKRIKQAAKKCELRLETTESMLFINTSKDVEQFFVDRSQFRQTAFYISQRKQRGYMLTESGGPLGGKWTFDAENRKKYPTGKNAPVINYPDDTLYYMEARDYIEEHFPENPGLIDAECRYPVTYRETFQWLDRFLEERFESFGRYQDAMLKNGSNLHHSLISPMLNVGLITPQELLYQITTYGDERSIPLNSVEGYLRQVLGWREFLKGVYLSKGGYQRTLNYWGFKRRIPASFWDGTSGIEPVDLIIRKVLETGYAHHIERLMVLGNFMLLCEFDPDEVYRWYMELFIDAYDWVMVPNVYGMSQYADGGLMSTKPYISSSNYVRKMSDFDPGPWQKVWDSLFWRFMNVHRNKLNRNPRLRMLIGSFDKMEEEKKAEHMTVAQGFLASL